MQTCILYISIVIIVRKHSKEASQDCYMNLTTDLTLKRRIPEGVPSFSVTMEFLEGLSNFALLIEKFQYDT